MSQLLEKIKANKIRRRSTRRESFVDLSAQVDAALEGMNIFQKDKFPFALAKALTQTATDAQAQVRARTRGTFNLHGNFIPAGVRIRPSKKSEIRATAYARADVHTAPIISGWMPLHETGGMKTPRGKYLVLPGKDLKSKSFRAITGKVKAQWTPKKLLAWYNLMTPTSEHGKGRRGDGVGNQAFITRTRNGNTPIIARRKGKAQYPLEILYVFVPRGRIKKAWGFEDVVHHTVRRNFNINLIRSIKENIR